MRSVKIASLTGLLGTEGGDGVAFNSQTGKDDGQPSGDFLTPIEECIFLVGKFITEGKLGIEFLAESF